jgi:hypothetical protein
MKKRGSKSVEAVAKRLIPGLSRGSRKIRKQIRAGHSPALGFLHIPKTGGSGISALGDRLVEAGQPFPSIFSHGWTLAAIRKAYPKMRVALIVRDPLERAISGFNSRLRQGRPAYKNPWKPAEAVAFALFPDVERWLDALVADDEWSLSARLYAARHVSHLRWNYRFYFEDPAAVREQAAAIALVGRIEETDTFIDALAAEAGIPPARLAGLYQRRHQAPAPTVRVLERYSARDVAKMRSRLAGEYAIYEALLALAGERAGAAA